MSKVSARELIEVYDDDERWMPRIEKLKKKLHTSKPTSDDGDKRQKNDDAL